MAKRKKPLPEDVLDYFREQGAKGGKKGAGEMTAAQRKARATKASKAAAVVRSAKKKAKGKG
jgi:hypothetical protein